jgi:hypothetical protein
MVAMPVSSAYIAGLAPFTKAPWSVGLTWACGLIVGQRAKLFRPTGGTLPTCER